ncbi:MAG TPA: aldehyde:ferredoxin oxidoreductase, partial [Dehalococcoidia bacterium]|nr:aldehyde:ferredoxin oxidoreductase [Dehalococcoidia bacterium]
FYRISGYDEKTGIPTRETLERLGLGKIARDLEKRGILPK